MEDRAVLVVDTKVLVNLATPLVDQGDRARSGAAGSSEPATEAFPNGLPVPTLSGNMPTVDSKGRVVLPQEVRERLGITPGSEVDIREEDGKAVVEPEADPEEIIDRLDQLVEETSPAAGETLPLDEGATPTARKHGDVIHRGAEQTGDE